jgi:hypothetical protein
LERAVQPAYTPPCDFSDLHLHHLSSMSEDNTDKPCFGVAACYQLGIVVTAQRNNTLFVHTHSPELGWTHAYVSTPAAQTHGWSFRAER